MNERIRDSIQFWNTVRPDLLAIARQRLANSEPCQFCDGTGLIKIRGIGKMNCACYIARHEANQAFEYRKHSAVSSTELAMTFEKLREWGGNKAHWSTMQNAICKLQALTRSSHNSRWVKLVGVNGCGKSHLLAATYNLVSNVAIYVPVGKLAGMFFSGLKRKDELTEDDDHWIEIQRLRDLLVEVPVLLLDDLGMEHDTDFVNSTLTDIVCQRYQLRHSRPTVVATNLPHPVMAKRYPRLESRIIDQDLVDVCGIAVGDYRSRDGKETNGRPNHPAK